MRFGPSLPLPPRPQPADRSATRIPGMRAEAATVNQPSRPCPNLAEMIGLFYGGVEALGAFTAVEAAEMPADYQRLLAHQNHMTVTVEEFHRCAVDVRALRRKATASHYARSSLLTRQTDGAVVQFGIMRMHMTVLAPEVRARIEAENIPLGRILIEHDVLRQIRPRTLWRVEPAAELAVALRLDKPRRTFGRTAMMDLNGEPAVELLEIVSPVD